MMEVGMTIMANMTKKVGLAALEEHQRVMVVSIEVSG